VPSSRILRLARALVAAACAGVFVGYVVCAARLVGFAWDWSPDEGLFLDGARRLLIEPAGLYARTWSPAPAAYGPGLPALLAPLAGLGMRMLPAARLLALAWTAAAAIAVYLLARPAGALGALAAAALSLAAFDLTSFSMLVRPDGPSLALWLFAASALLPARLERGADRLDSRRTIVGATLLLLGTLTKITVVLHGAPLVLGWLLVDRRSALRLGAALALAGAAVVLALQWATAGGYLWVNGGWALHGTQPGLRALILSYSLERMWAHLAVAAAALALAVAAGRGPAARRDPSLLLVAGALLIVPLLSKYGASWNYMLPLLPALAVAAARWGALAAGERPQRRLAAAAALAGVAALLATTRGFPLPTPLDERTAAAFYAFVDEHTRRSGGPILALRPELAYFVVGQAVETEGSSFSALAQHGAPGCDRVLERLRLGVYTLVVRLHELPRQGGYVEALAARYVHAGGCNLSFYFGTTPVHLFTRRDLPLYMAPPPATRCGGPSGS
jgi:hypothetical protein